MKVIDVLIRTWRYRLVDAERRRDASGPRLDENVRAPVPGEADRLRLVDRCEIRSDPQVGHRNQLPACIDERKSIAPPRQYACVLQQVLQVTAMRATRQLQFLAASSKANL